MNIKQFYDKQALISLNASIMALIPPFFFIMFGIMISPDKHFVFLMVPFLVYSFISFQVYLIQRQRANEIEETSIRNHKEDSSLMKEDTVLITFMPAPTLRMLIFGEDGVLLGEWKDMQFAAARWFMPYFMDRFYQQGYGLFDQRGKLIAHMVLKRKKTIIISNDKVIELHNKDQPHHYVDPKRHRRYTVKQSKMFTDIKFSIDEDQFVAELRKGWMPLEWDLRFKDANTPVLRFGKNLTNEDKMVLLSLLAKQFQSTNH